MGLKMNDITALEAKYKELGAEIEALKSAKTKEWPQVGDKYSMVTTFGKIDTATYDEDIYDIDCKAIGNVFRTKEEATKELETRTTIAELRAQPGRKKFVVGVANFHLNAEFDHCIITIFISRTIDQGFASIYFESKQAVQEAINTVGEARILAAAKWLAMGE
jgi:hypothetical protein